MVDNLLCLEEETQPSTGEGSEYKKTIKARLALSLAGTLVEHLAGWAIDHEIGRVLEDGGPVYKVDGPLSSKDDHHFEAVASDYTFDDPTQNRRILVRLLEKNSGGFPIALACLASWALAALDAGETDPMLSPERTGKRNPAYTLLLHQMRAIEHVEFRRGTGKTANEARDIVGQAYNVNARTIEKWETRLQDELGAFEVSSTRDWAREIGQVAQEQTTSGEKKDKFLGSFMVESYNDSALRRDADGFNFAQRQHKKP